MSRGRKILLALVGTAIIVVSYLLYSRRNRTGEYLDLREDGLGAQRNENRSYNFLLQDVPPGIFSFFNPNALTITSEYKPWINYSNAVFNDASRNKNAENARWLVETFDDIVTEVSRSIRLPRCIMYAVMLAETGSVAARANYRKEEYDRIINANTSGALGPMQVKPITATETVQISLNKGFISDYHTIVLQDTLGMQRANKIFIREKPNSKYFIDNKIIGYDNRKYELQDDRLNIMIAGLKLINLIDNYGEQNLHQVFYAYNQGDRTVLVRDLKKYTDPSTFVRNTSGEGKAYVERILGKHGSLDIMINDLNIFA